MSKARAARIEKILSDEVPAQTASLSRLCVRTDVDLFRGQRSWQLFNWHQSTKDRSYLAPRALEVLSYVHKEAHVPTTPARRPTPLRYFLCAAAVGLVISTALGVIMAYPFSRQPLVATICLFAGIALPGLLLWIYK